MKKFGIFIIKPDAVNKHDLKIVRNVLDKYGFSKTICFRLKDYCKLMQKYREADILFKNFQNSEAEIKGCGVALSAYKQLYPSSDGFLMLIPLGKESFKEFYDKANVAKREIRKQIEEDRGYCFAYINYLTNPQLTKMSHEEYNKLKDKDRENINKAYINGVHLEDYECLENNFCLNFMVENGVIAKSNKIDLNKLTHDLQDEQIY